MRQAASRTAGSVAGWVVLAVAACGADTPTSAIDAVIVEPAPGLGVRLERVRLVVERLAGDGRFHDREPVYADAQLAPIAIHVLPERPDDPGRQLYRLRAEGSAGGALRVARQHRVVFVPGRTITLPFRLEAACLGVSCGADTTCSEGRCVDDRVAACDLEGASGAAFCRGDAAPAAPLDAAAGEGGVEPVDGGAPDARPDADAGAGCVCLIEGRCRGLFEPNPAEPCEHCDPVQSVDGWTVAVDFPCDDGLYCTLNERCDAARVCADRGPDRRACWDGNGCTMDVCDEDADVCRNPPQPGSCTVGGTAGSCCRDTCLPSGTPCI